MFEQIQGQPVLLHLCHNLRMGGRFRLDAGDVRQAVWQQLEQFCGLIGLMR
jgi:hypothetical protein